jgi:hypothetical protein
MQVIQEGRMQPFAVQCSGGAGAGLPITLPSLSLIVPIRSYVSLSVFTLSYQSL